MNASTPNGHNPNRGHTRDYPDAATLARDTIELGELQLRLLRADIQAAVSTARTGLVMLATGVAMMVAAAPMFLFALAAWLEARLQWGQAEAYLATGIGAATVSAGLLATGWFVVKRCTANLERSGAELKKNAAWVKQMISPSSEYPETDSN